jgi:hypothetical protein
VIVDFEPWEYVHAHDIGIRRAVANWNVKDKKSYTNGRNQPEIIASPAAALCELAVAKALNKFWGGHVWDNRDHRAYKHMADIEPNIEVRRIRDKKNPIAVWQKDYGKGRILVVCFPIEPEFRQVEILGWLPLDVAWEKGEQRYADDCRVFPVDRLRDINSLKEQA